MSVSAPIRGKLFVQVGNRFGWRWSTSSTRPASGKKKERKRGANFRENRWRHIRSSSSKRRFTNDVNAITANFSSLSNNRIFRRLEQHYAILFRISIKTLRNFISYQLKFSYLNLSCVAMWWNYSNSPGVVALSVTWELRITSSVVIESIGIGGRAELIRATPTKVSPMTWSIYSFFIVVCQELSAVPTNCTAVPLLYAENVVDEENKIELGEECISW